jgi:hypothetical protein
MRAEKSWKDSWAGPAKKVVGDKDILGRSEQLICNLFLDEQSVCVWCWSCLLHRSQKGATFTQAKHLAFQMHIWTLLCAFLYTPYFWPINGQNTIYASYSYLRVIYFVYPHRHHAFSASSDRGISTDTGNVHPCCIDRKIPVGIISGE